MQLPTDNQRYIFLALNVIRFFSIVSLLFVFASSIEAMVTNANAVKRWNDSSNKDDTNCEYIEGSSVPNQAAGVFWSMVSSLLIIFQTIILIMSEVGWPVRFFNTFFPVLGSEFGTGALGIFQGLIGAQVLSHHVDEFTLFSGFFLFAVACLNMFAGLIFRKSGKQRRSIRALKASKTAFDRTLAKTTSPFDGHMTAAFTGGSNSSWKTFDKGFGREGEKSAALRGFILQTPPEALPMYTSPSPSMTFPQPAYPQPKTNEPDARSDAQSVKYNAPRPENPAIPPSEPRTRRGTRYTNARTTISSWCSPGTVRGRDSIPSLPPTPAYTRDPEPESPSYSEHPVPHRNDDDEPQSAFNPRDSDPFRALTPEYAKRSSSPSAYSCASKSGRSASPAMKTSRSPSPRFYRKPPHFQSSGSAL